MKPTMTGPPSLISLVVRRIVLFAAIAMVAQIVGVFFEYWRDTPNLGRLAIEMETEALAQGLTVADGHAAFKIPDSVARPLRMPHEAAISCGCWTRFRRHSVFELRGRMRRLFSVNGNQAARFLDDGAAARQASEHRRRPAAFRTTPAPATSTWRSSAIATASFTACSAGNSPIIWRSR